MAHKQKIESYKDFIVWQKSVDFVVSIYKVTENFPDKEIYGLISQLRRASISIPSNIAEGNMRFSNVEFRRFLRISYGSGAEIETQLEIANRLKYISEDKFIKLHESISEIQKMLNSLISKIKV